MFFIIAAVAFSVLLGLLGLSINNTRVLHTGRLPLKFAYCALYVYIRGGFKGGPTGPGPPHSAPTVLYARAMTLAVMAKKQQKRLTAWLSVDEEPAKRTRQDDNRAVVEDAPLVAGGGDEASVSPALMSDSSTCSRFDPSSLTLPNSVGPDNPSTRLTLC